MAWSNQFSGLLGLFTIAGDIICAALILLLFSPNQHPLRRKVARYALGAMFLVALGGSVGSLIYSEVLRFAPCNMCWYQRAVLYPQIIILAVALFYGDRRVARYIAWLSAIGVILALYTHGLEMGWLPEGAVCGTGPTCARLYVLEFGYVTIPIMAATGFLLNFLLSLFLLKEE